MNKMGNILKALGGVTNASGGFTVPEIWSKEILAYVQANSVTIPDMQQVVMTSDLLHLPKVTGGSTARWIAENTVITGADMAFGETQLIPKKVAALMTVSTELLEDSNAAIARVVTEQMGKDLALAVDKEILDGTGGNFTGLGFTGSTANTQSAGTVSWQGLVSASDKILGANHQYPDRIYVHPTTLGKFRVLTDGSARPMFNQETWGSPLLKEGVIGTMLGCGVKITTQLTSSKLIMGKTGNFGYYANRRALQFNRDYNIDSDNIVLQANMRSAFAVKYGSSYALWFGIA